MLVLGQMRTRTCQGVSRRAVLQIGASSVLGLSLADLLRLRAADSSGSGSAAPGAVSVVVGRPRAPGHLGPQARRSPRFSRPFFADRYLRHRRPRRRAVPASRPAGPSPGHRAFAAHRLQRSWRGRHHRSDRQRGRRRRTRRQAAARLGAVRPWAAWWRACAAPARNCRPFWSSAAACTREKRPSSARAAARSAPSTIRFVSNTIRSRARASPPCNCRPTSRPSASAIVSACCKPSTDWLGKRTRCTWPARWMTTADRRSPC